MTKRSTTKRTGNNLWLFCVIVFGSIIFVTLMKSLHFPVISTTSQNPKLADDLREYIQQVIETELPAKDSHIFTEPEESAVHDFTMIIQSMEQDENIKAQALAEKYNYSVTIFTDTEYKDKVYGILKENPPYTRGWGIFIIHPGVSSRNVIVETPHPIDDIYTARVGVDLLRHLDGKKLFIAGTDRYAKLDNSSDTARNPKSMFHLLSVQFANNNDWIIQPHGFNKTANDPDIIVSAGTTDVPSFLPQLNTSINNEGLTSQYFDAETKKLGATTNTQGQDIRSKGGKFIHIESSLTVRSSYTQYSKMIKALALVIPVKTKVYAKPLK